MKEENEYIFNLMPLFESKEDFLFEVQNSIIEMSQDTVNRKEELIFMIAVQKQILEAGIWEYYEKIYKQKELPKPKRKYTKKL